MPLKPVAIAARAAQIKLLILDVDGVLTDGFLYYSENGEELKRFNAKDGLGIRLLMENGIQVAVITARDSEPLRKRMEDLKINLFFPGQDDKLAIYELLIQKLQLEKEQIAYAGDDILDLPIMRRVGLSISPADGHFVLKNEAHFVTSQDGGKGAVREIADTLLSSRTDLVRAYDLFLEKKLGQGDLTKL